MHDISLACLELAEVGLEFLILLPLPSKCGDYKHAAFNLAGTGILVRLVHLSAIRIQ